MPAIRKRYTPNMCKRLGKLFKNAICKENYSVRLINVNLWMVLIHFKSKVKNQIKSQVNVFFTNKWFDIITFKILPCMEYQEISREHIATVT